jgi:nitronate monooxygenase
MRTELPIVLAPMAGGPSTPELCAAVSDAGGLGFLAAGYLSASALAERLERTRALTDRPFGVNLFVPGPPSEPDVYRDYVAELGEPKFNDDGWDAKLEVVADVPVVSFTFGCPAPEVLARFEESWVTITSADEARRAVDAGASAVIVQGAEAGGHRGSWEDHDEESIGLLALLQLVDVEVPRIAAGGIATPQAVQAVLTLGADAAQVGTAFMRAPEAGTTPVHADRLTTDEPTAMTRAFSGRLARGIKNRFMADHPDAPSAYPEIHYATAQRRAEARKAGDSDGFNLWAGQAHALARPLPAGEIARWLAGSA